MYKRLIIINDVSAEFELSHILKNFQSKKCRARNMCQFRPEEP